MGRVRLFAAQDARALYVRLSSLTSVSLERLTYSWLRPNVAFGGVPMLVLNRKPQESVYIGDTIQVTVVSVRGNQVRLAFTAPDDVTIHRSEIYELLGKTIRPPAPTRRRLSVRGDSGSLRDAVGNPL